MPDDAQIDALIAAYRPGWSLDQAFYTHPGIYRREIDRIFMRSWLFAGHASQIPAPGDYFLFEVAEEKTAPLLGPGPQRAHTWQEIVALAGQHPVTPEPTSTFAFAVEASRSLMTR